MSVLLIQPAHPHRGDQVYLPGGLMNLAGRLIESGLQVRVLDLNFDDLRSHRALVRASDRVGITAVGKPYIPGIISLTRSLRAMGYERPIMVGGPAVERMEPLVFRRLFADERVWQSINDNDLMSVLNQTIATRYVCGMEQALAQLPERRRKAYLTREFGLWLSDGCTQSCNFCDANKGVPEHYRDFDAFLTEVTYICDELQRWGHDTLEVYLSNLDAFQSAEKLERYLKALYGVASDRGITVKARCLATTAYFNKMYRRDSARLARLQACGLRIIGFGVDGADPDVWARENKRHNTVAGVKKALQTCLDEGITVEMLMVIGFNQDGPRALASSILSSLRWTHRGVILRPYLAKPIVQEMSQGEVVPFLRDPRKLRSLDYAALASRVTHPRRAQRWMVNATYLSLIALLTPVGRNTTFPILPEEGNRLRRRLTRLVNRYMPFDR